MDRGGMKKRILAVLCACLLLGTAGCRRVMDDYEGPKAGYRAAASCWPIYELCLMAMDGVEGVTLSCLTQPQDGCLRAYELSEWDARRAAGYDLIVLGGRGLESYAAALSAWEGGPTLLTCMTGMELINQGVKVSDEDASHFDAENPWLFLSPEGAERIVKSICANMQALDPDYADKYAENYAAASEALKALGEDMRYACLGLEGKKAAVLHEGLLYFAQFMDIEVAYTFPRESGDGVVDNDLAALLAGLADSGAEAVLLEEQAPDALARSLEAAGYRVCRLDTLSAHPADGDREAYGRIMRENAERWKKIWDGEARKGTS